MPAFEFIVDKGLRASLDSDWKELQDAFQNSAWKAVHVLAGSIVEAILVDHLISIGYQKKGPLRMSLDEAIEACKAEGILSDKTAELSTVIRRFRNLIHPGRAVRLAETPDVHGATVAQCLVLIIRNEVAAAKKTDLRVHRGTNCVEGRTDGSVLAILSHLFKKTNDREIGRLRREVLPERYRMMDMQDEPDLCMPRIQKTFHAAFEVARPETKKSVARQFMKVLHEEDGATVNMYERVFFRSSPLRVFRFRGRPRSKGASRG